MNEDEGTNDIADELRAAWRDLSDQERRELARTWEIAEHGRETHPDPHGAERRLMGAVAARPSSRVRHTQRRMWIVAAALVIIAAGIGVYLAERPPTDTYTAATAREFMLILHGEPLVRYPVEEHPRIIGEYVAWARELVESGRFVAGDELAPGGRILSVRSGDVNTQHIENVAEAASGYFIIAAADLDEAAQIAADCPHLKYDGTVEVRQIGTN